MKKNILFTTLAVFMSAMLFAQEASPALETEPEKEWGVSLSLQYANRYFDKGKYSNTDPILQGDVEFTWKQLFIGATGFFDLTDENDHRHTFEEYDYIAGWRPVIGGDWDFFIKGIDVQLAYIHYEYPRYDEDNSNEFNLAVNAQCLLAPGVDIYWDFEHDLWYGNFNVSHSFQLFDKLALNLESQLWWGNRRFQERDYDVSLNSFISVVCGASLEYAITDNLKIGPFVQCGWALGQRMKESWEEEEDQSAFNSCYGVSLAWDF